MKIYIVVGDTGSAKELVPAARELTKRGAKVSWFADRSGKAASEVLAKEQIEFSHRGPEPGDRPDRILVGTSASAVDLQIAWTKFGKKKCVTVLWLEDLWGTGEREVARETDPDVMLVVDRAAADIAHAVRPNMSFAVVGKPTFEKLGSYIPHAGDIRKSIRTMLGVDNTDVLVSYWSEGERPERVEEHLAQLRHLMGMAVGDFVLATRIHPKIPDERRKRLWEYAISGAVRAVDARKEIQEELIIASDVVVSDWGGTAGYIAVLLGIPTIVTLFPDDKEWREGAGYPQGVPPLVATHAADGARDPEELFGQLALIASDRVVAKRRTLTFCEPFLPLLKTGSARRIAEAVQGFMRVI